MYCPNCGKENSAVSQFCEYCGTEQSNAIVTKTPSESQQNSIIMVSTDYAGFWIRFGAYMIDMLGVYVVVIILGFALVLFNKTEILNTIPHFFISYVCFVIYNTLSLTIWSTTFGKMLYGLSVKLINNEKLTYVIALKRSLLQPLSTLFFGIGYINMRKNPYNQAWHDKLSGTIVVCHKRASIFAYIFTVIALIEWALSLSSE